MIKRARLRVYVYVFLALFLMSLLPAITANGFRVSQINLGFLLISLLVAALLIWLLDRRQTRRAIRELLKDEKQDRGQLGRHRIRLSEADIQEQTDVGESRNNWTGIDRVEENEQYIFIYTTPHAAYVIPKRAFNSSAAAKEFYDFARLHCETAVLT